EVRTITTKAIRPFIFSPYFELSCRCVLVLINQSNQT
ncbi:unnamed protein product, partial [Brassica oleracea]